jgi:hypothetical protein
MSKKFYGMSMDDYEVYLKDNDSKFTGDYVNKLVFDRCHRHDNEDDLKGVFLNTMSKHLDMKSKGFDYGTFYRGIYYDESKWDSNLVELKRIICEEDGDVAEEQKLYDCLENSMNMVIVSTRVKELFEDNEIPGVQFLPLTNIRDLDDTLIEGYYFMNIYHILPLDIVDFESAAWAEYVFPDKKMTSLMAPSFKQTMIKDEYVFLYHACEYRADLYQGHFFTRKTVELIRQNGLTGFFFYPARISYK